MLPPSALRAPNQHLLLLAQVTAQKVTCFEEIKKNVEEMRVSVGLDGKVEFDFEYPPEMESKQGNLKQSVRG